MVEFGWSELIRCRMSVSELIRCRCPIQGVGIRVVGITGFRDMSEMRVFGICRNYGFSARYQIRSRIGITGIRELSKLDLGLFCVT